MERNAQRRFDRWISPEQISLCRKFRREQSETPCSRVPFSLPSFSLGFAEDPALSQLAIERASSRGEAHPPPFRVPRKPRTERVDVYFLCAECTRACRAAFPRLTLDPVEKDREIPALS